MTASELVENAGVPDRFQQVVILYLETYEARVAEPGNWEGPDSSGGIVIDDSLLVPDSSAPANGIAVDSQFVSNPLNVQILDPEGGVQFSSELVDDHPSRGLSILDSGPMPQPQDAASPASDSRWQTLLQLGFVGLQAWGQWNAAHSTPARAAALGKAKATGWQNQPRSNSNSMCGPGYYVNPNFLAGLPWTPGQSVCVANGTTQPHAAQILQSIKQAGQPAPQTQQPTSTTPLQDPCQAQANAAFSAPTIGAFSYLMTLYQACENAHGK